ncbi:MAG: tRNA uridine-5-carboxymethylaminomethyl(34) synthesis GTPase MnmE [Treponema sp.]|jgi:tRNA modification GTPase|nr:tRNA uridine-5-carboxymethylaminomethyl(34) synthesis GTPase MnmE [Treponema sp.]
MRSYGDEAPIAALATAPGPAALAVIRLSGAGTITLLQKCFSRPAALAAAPGRTVVHGWIQDAAGGLLDEVMAAVYRAPASYTGEEAAEVTCHGGAGASRAVLGALRAAGFEDALPGEFTFRAFMHGKVDLTRAESVMELVGAATERGVTRAARRLAGALERELREISGLLKHALAEVELCLDYSEDDGVPLPAGDGQTALPGRAGAEEALARLEALAGGRAAERLLAEGAFVVIAGRPNAGKSSLFNRLLREERSIVTPSPGTTRDWIEAAFSLGGIPVRLADTAGLRDAASGAGAEAGAEAERLGIERSRALAARADVILYLLDPAAGLHDDDRRFLQALAAPGQGGPRVILFSNKSDLYPPDAAGATALARDFPSLPLLAGSARTGEGIEALLAALSAALEEKAPLEEALGPGTDRQMTLISQSCGALHEALALAGRGAPLDLCASPLREALDRLGELSGEVTTADILEEMFSTFCVGK